MVGTSYHTLAHDGYPIYHILLVLCITMCMAWASQTSLSTQDVTAKRSVKNNENQEPEKLPGETSGDDN